MYNLEKKKKKRIAKIRLTKENHKPQSISTELKME